jgi:AcrR family transcriptional regulator
LIATLRVFLVASIKHNVYGNVKLTKKYKMKKTAAVNPAAPKQRRAVAPSGADEDHRVRTGAARSEQTRRKLLVAALAVFAEKGTDAPVIDDFIAAAAVARGTFYNYFNTTQALLSAVTAELIDEILFRVDIEVRKIDDPVERVVCGSLLYMHIAVDNPTWGGFMIRAGLRGDAAGKLVDVYLPRDLQMASDAGKARFPSVRAARDLVVGCVMQSVASVLSGAAPRSHVRDAFSLVLQGIGVAPARARQLCAMDLPLVELPTGFGPSGLHAALQIEPGKRTKSLR